MCNFRKPEEFEIPDNGSTVQIVIQDTDRIMKNSDLKTEQDLKQATNILNVENNVPETDEANGDQPKVQTEAGVKIENVKVEQSNSRISRPMVSPHKRKRSRLNY